MGRKLETLPTSVKEKGQTRAWALCLQLPCALQPLKQANFERVKGIKRVRFQGCIRQATAA